MLEISRRIYLERNYFYLGPLESVSRQMGLPEESFHDAVLRPGTGPGVTGLQRRSPWHPRRT